MNLMQTNLEQVFKEYLEIKLFVEQENKKIVENKKELAQRALEIEDDVEQAELFFDLSGYIYPLTVDMMQMKTKLYYYYHAYKDLIVVPVEIENELQDYSIRTTFAVKNGNKEIVDQELYNHYKQQQVDVVNYQKNQQGA